MSCPAAIVVTESCPTIVEIQVDPIPPVSVDLCTQGPPGPPGMSNSMVPFYLADGTESFIQLMGGDIPFYLADGTPQHIGVV